MKRWIGTLALMLVAGAAMAQAPFTIVRPADNSRVREKVHILIPRDSIPPGGYVGIFLGDQFLEATVPPLQGKYYVYTLDTKGRGIPDTKPGQPLKLELVLYVDYNDQPRIVDRSSVNVNIANTSSITVPNDGLKLRYRFVQGAQWIYGLEQRTIISTISEAQNANGGKPAEFPAESENFRMMYSVDGTFPDGDGLVRMQALPPKGKEYAEITASGASSPQRYTNDEMAPLYMRVSPTGNQVWGSAPPYVELEGSAASGASSVDLFAAFPLPSLPLNPVRPGDSWPSRFQNGAIDLSKLREVNTLVHTFPARGEFVGVEWELGHPCAKIRNSIAAATESVEDMKLKAKNAAFTGGDKVSVTETIWFALDTRRIVRIIRDQSVDTKTQNSTGGFGGTGSGYPGGVGGYPGGMRGGGVGGGTRSGDLGIDRGLNQMSPGAYGGGQRGGGYPGMSGSGYPGMSGGMRGGTGFGGLGSGRSGATSGGATFTRVRTQMIFTLQQ